MASETHGRRVAELLRGDIVNGHFAAGEKLPPERELMERYSIGRNTLREAVQGLVALGMLEVRAGRGTTVTRADGRFAIARSFADRQFDEAALRDLVEFRLLLEGEAASLAAQRATDEDLVLIRDRLAAYQNGVRNSDDVYAHDVAFHRAIAAATHNRLYVDVIDTSSQLFQTAMRAADRASGDVLEAAKEHAMIAHHVLLGEAEAAENSMRDHILAGNRRRLRNGYDG